MNKPTRKQLQKIIDSLENLQAELEEISENEQEKLDNTPENLQGSERYERAEEICGYLEEALCSFEDLIDHITDAIEE